MNLPELFAESFVKRGDAIGLEFDGREYSFAELDRRSNRLARRWLEDGFRPGDRVAVYLRNSIELIDAYLAAVKIGLVFTPINILYREREIAYILQDAEPRGLVVSRDHDGVVRPGLRGRNEPHLYFAEDLEEMARHYPSVPPPCPADADTVAALIYTSGTTGRPKGAMLTHGNFAANARNLIESWRITAEDRLLLALPLFHVHGLGNGLHTWLAAGYRLRLLERFRKEAILGEFLDFRPTIFFGVPTMYERLLAAPPDTARRIGGFMRLFVSGSAALPAHTLKRFAERYGHVILERYGMTETLMNLSNPYDGERRPGSVGLPLPRVSVRLGDPETGEARDERDSGEIQIKGPNVFGGYWRRPDATAEAFTEDGWFRSGDLAFRSADGYYTLQGRRTELIITGGFNVYPREVEEFLEEQPEVAEAAVVGAPDPVKGEVPVAFVAPASGARVDPEALQRRCRDHLASFKVPRRFIRVDELPRNALGKIQRHRLPAVATVAHEQPGGQAPSGKAGESFAAGE